jgi:hypothetical protein
VQERAQRLAFTFSYDGPRRLGPARPGCESSESAAVEIPKNITHGLCSAPQHLGDVRDALTACTGEKDLAAADGERIARAEPVLKLSALINSQRSEKHWWLHTTNHSTERFLHKIFIARTLVTTVDIADTDEVIALVGDRLIELQVDEGLPVYVTPLRPIERVIAELREREAAMPAPLPLP